MLPVVSFLLIWIFALLTQIEIFNVGIFDYGVAYNLVWREAFNIKSFPSNVGYLPYYYPYKLISFLLVPYVLLFPGISDLLVMQVLIVAVPSIILYFLALKLTKRISISIALEVLWLIYYPNNSLLMYYFHFQTLFPVFYMLGFFLFFCRKLKLSLASFFLAALTNLLSPIILIFTIPTLYIHIKKMKEHYTNLNAKIFAEFASVILIVSMTILLLNLYIGGFSFFQAQAIPSTSTSSNLPIYTALWEKFINLSGVPGFLYILFMTFPLVFSIFVKYEYLFAAIPSILFYLVGYAGGYLRYFYPMQYSVFISPMIFISFIFLIYSIQNNNETIRHEKKSKFLRKFTSLQMPKRKSITLVIILALLLNIGLFSIYSPLGPLNSELKSYSNYNPPSNGGYNLYSNLTVSNYDKNLLSMSELVPQNSTVLSQFNMPQFSNRYYFTYPGQYNPRKPIDYAINDPENTYWFCTPVSDTGPDFYDYNMMELSNRFLSNSSYGVYGQSEGAILFKYFYSGNPIFYIPFEQNYSLKPLPNDTFGMNDFLINPGEYRISIETKNNTNSPICLGGLKLGSIKGSNFEAVVNFSFYSFSDLYIKGKNNYGNLTIDQISVAKEVNLNTKLPSPSKYKIFQSNYSSFSHIEYNKLNLDTREFSYLYMINLSSFEDGMTVPVRIGNDSQVFSIGNSVWNQIENNGYLEFGFRNRNLTISQYLKPYSIQTNNWVFVDAEYNNGSVNIFIDGINIYSSQIFPFSCAVQSNSPLMIGGAHPFLHDNKTYPNSNPLNASLANFVIVNGPVSLSDLENPASFIGSINVDQNIAYENWLN